MNNEIIIFENQGIKLNVNLHEETVWLTQAQIAILFEKDRTVIGRHIKNIFNEEELDEKSNVQKMHVANSDKDVIIYNLDVIISVGYRVKSKNGIIFRRWANKVLKDYLLKGYAVNEIRLKALEKTVQLLDVAARANSLLDSGDDAKKILKVLGDYTKALDLLDNYDHKSLPKIEGRKSNKTLSYDECAKIIKTLKYSETSGIFGVERPGFSLESIILNVYQSFGGEEIYPTVEDKIANLLYLVVKNHVFIDGNKRIAATLFVYALDFYDLLYRNDVRIIDNNSLAAITFLIAESNPKEKPTMIDLVKNFIA